MQSVKLILVCYLLGLNYSLLFTQTLLRDGFQLKTELTKGETHLYEVKLKKGQYAEVVFLQQGVDLDVTLFNASMDSIGYLDSPNGSDGPEQYTLVAENSGSYYFQVEPLKPEDEGLTDKTDSTYLDYLEQNQGVYSVEKVLILSAKAYQQKRQEAAARTQRLIDWFREQARPLRSLEAGNGFEDLQFLQPVLKDVRIVGLGEATHGTREFFQMKHRLLEFLVMEMDFRVFAIEASYPACKNINDYVLHGIGTKEKALASQGFWTWDTEEVLEMIEWMRTYNQNVAPEKRVQFLGFDVQVLRKSEAEVDTFLLQADADLSAKFREINHLRDTLNKRRPSVDQVLIADIDRRYNELLTDMILSQGRLISLQSKEVYARGMEHLRILVQGWRQAKARLLQQWNPEMRDYYMADNVLYLHSKLPAGTKMILWGHNSHVAADPEASVNAGIKPMGAYLREAFGDTYYAISFAFNQGGFQAMAMNDSGFTGVLKGFTVDPALEGTLEWIFAQAQQPVSFLNLRQDLSAELRSYFKNEVRSWQTGAGFYPSWRNYDSPTYKKYSDYTRYFDGVIFVETTTRARPSEAVKGRMKKVK